MMRMDPACDDMGGGNGWCSLPCPGGRTRAGCGARSGILSFPGTGCWCAERFFAESGASPVVTRAAVGGRRSTHERRVQTRARVVNPQTGKDCPGMCCSDPCAGQVVPGLCVFFKEDGTCSQGGAHALAVGWIGPVEVHELAIDDEGRHPFHRAGDVGTEACLVGRIQQAEQRTGLAVVVVAGTVVVAVGVAADFQGRFAELRCLLGATEGVRFVVGVGGRRFSGP